MTPNDFCYWLHGWTELKGDKAAPTAIQWQVIVDHLDLVFDKVTPDVGSQSTYAQVTKRLTYC